MPNRPFTVGTKCKTKKVPHRFCTITGVDPTATKKNTWVIKFDDDGSTRAAVKSQQLLRLTEDDVMATVSINSTSEEETERTAPESENDSDLEHRLAIASRH